MNETETVLAVAVGIIGLFLVWKLRKLLLILSGIAVVVGGVLCFSGEIDCPFGRGVGTLPGGLPDTLLPSPPTDEEIIRAVRSHLSAKTFTKIQYIPEPRFCSQYDVDADLHMPRNPELARCPRVGATYTVTIPKKVPMSCSGTIGSNVGWFVQPAGDNRWQVSKGGSRWDVTLIHGGRADMNLIYIQSTASQFAFMISPHQEC